MQQPAVAPMMAPSNSYSGGTPADQSGQAPGQEIETADPNDPRPSSKPPVRIEEDIPVNEQPGPRAAQTIPVSGGGASGRINFPRDAGDDVDILKLQIYLDFHGYSVAEIDGRWGYNTERALYVYQKNNGIEPTGQLDDKMLARINSFTDGYLLDYTLTADDLKGPFKTIPRDYYAQSHLSWLPYESALEALGEKFHSCQALLRKLNPGTDFDNLQPGQRILAPNVVDGIDEKRGSVAVIRVSKSNKWTEVFDAEGRFVFYYPSTMGHNEHDPLPVGNYRVENVIKFPPFKYKPSLFWDEDHNKPEADIPPGPNSPVGCVWIGTSRPSVGIHGTPNPENISKNTSHGCIRLANWDALQLSKRVKVGTKIEFVE